MTCVGAVQFFSSSLLMLAGVLIIKALLLISGWRTSKSLDIFLLVFPSTILSAYLSNRWSHQLINHLCLEN